MLSSFWIRFLEICFGNIIISLNFYYIELCCLLLWIDNLSWLFYTIVGLAKESLELIFCTVFIVLFYWTVFDAFIHDIIVKLLQTNIVCANRQKCRTGEFGILAAWFLCFIRIPKVCFKLNITQPTWTGAVAQLARWAFGFVFWRLWVCIQLNYLLLH